MIGGHPGGIRLTRRLLELAGAAGPGNRPVETDQKALDLGSGSGETVRYLRSLGYDAAGIDREAGVTVHSDRPGAKAGTIHSDGPGAETVTLHSPGANPVTAGDMTALPFLDGTYDLCLAECSVAVCGDGPAALREAYRVLRPGGSLLLSDVFFAKENAPCLSMPGPLTLSCWEREFHRAGYVIEKVSDETALWKEFFLESLWNDNADDAFCGFFKEAGRAGCGYFLAWLKKPEQSKGEKDGFI